MMRWRSVVGALVVVLGTLVFWKGPVPVLSALAPMAAAWVPVWPALEADADLEPEPGPAASDPAHRNEIVLCGGAQMALDAEGRPTEEGFERATRSSKILDRLLASLRADPGVRAQAAVLIHDADEAEVAAMKAAGDCTPEGACIRSLQSTAGAPAVDALARLAVLHQDPLVYQWALNRCSLPAIAASAPACSQLSAAQWARLDPDNALPWLASLDAALASGDKPAAVDALHRIATSQRANQGFGSLAGLWLEHATIDDADLPGLLLAATFQLGSDARLLPNVASVRKLCGPADLRDSNRQQECWAAADVFAEHSDTLTGRLLGIGIGRSVGWSTDRVDRMRGETDAFLAAHLTEPAMQSSTFFGAALPCDEARTQLDRLRRIGSDGESAQLREWLAHSSYKPEDFIRQQRDRQASQDAAMRSQPGASGAGR